MIKSCYRCRAVFDTDDPNQNYCDDCLEDMIESGRLVQFPNRRGPASWWNRLQDWFHDMTGRLRGEDGHRSRPSNARYQSGRRRFGTYPGTDWDSFYRLLAAAAGGAALGHLIGYFSQFSSLGLIGGLAGLYFVSRQM